MKSTIVKCLAACAVLGVVVVVAGVGITAYELAKASPESNDKQMQCRVEQAWKR